MEKKNTDMLKSEISRKNHEVKIMTNSYVKQCKDLGIPVFVAYYVSGKGYQYNAQFPEEIGTPEVIPEYGKFNKFLQVCMDFNKEDYFPHINDEE